jgi:hypothetical protein
LVIILDAIIPFAKQGDIFALYPATGRMAGGIADDNPMILSGHDTSFSLSAIE